MAPYRPYSNYLLFIKGCIKELCQLETMSKVFHVHDEAHKMEIYQYFIGALEEGVQDSVAHRPCLARIQDSNI